MALLELKHARRGLVEGCALQGGVTECLGAWGRPGGLAICSALDTESPPTPVLSRSHQTQSWFSASLQRSAELREVLRECASGPRCMLWKDDAPGEVSIELVHSRGNSPTQLSTFASTPSPAAKLVLETCATRATCEKRENCAKL